MKLLTKVWLTAGGVLTAAGFVACKDEVKDQLKNETTFVKVATVLSATMASIVYAPYSALKDVFSSKKKKSKKS